MLIAVQHAANIKGHFISSKIRTILLRSLPKMQDPTSLFLFISCPFRHRANTNLKATQMCNTHMCFGQISEIFLSFILQSWECKKGLLLPKQGHDLPMRMKDDILSAAGAQFKQTLKWKFRFTENINGEAIHLTGSLYFFKGFRRECHYLACSPWQLSQKNIYSDNKMYPQVGFCLDLISGVATIKKAMS